jgi:ATP-dependent DNA helicase 2 subunit 2
VFSALALAIEMIKQATTNKAGGKLQYTRKIYVVTDGTGYLDTSDLEDMVEKLKELKIEITLLQVFWTRKLHPGANMNRGVDFDDPESGYKEEDKDPDKV